MRVDKSKMGATWPHKMSREKQEEALRGSGAQHIVHAGVDGITWRDVANVVREGDTVYVPWLAMVATKRGEDAVFPANQPAEFLLEVHERGGVVIEAETGRDSSKPKDRRAMIADAARGLRKTGRPAPSNGRGPGRPRNAYSDKALARNKTIWFSRKYTTNEAAAEHMLEGMTAHEAWQRYGKSGRPWRRKR